MLTILLATYYLLLEGVGPETLKRRGHYDVVSTSGERLEARLIDGEQTDNIRPKDCQKMAYKRVNKRAGGKAGSRAETETDTETST